VIDGWEERSIAELAEDVIVGHVGTSSDVRDESGVRFLMGKNVGPGYLKLEQVERVSFAFHRSQRKSQLSARDVVVVRIGNPGQAAMIPENFGEANCSGLVIVKGLSDIMPEFLVYFLNSPIGRARSLSNARGSTRQTLNTSTVAEMSVPVPPFADQQRIVAKLDEVIKIVSDLEQVAFQRRRLFGEFARSWIAGALERTGGKVEKLGDLASVDYGERVVRARDGGTRYPVYGGGGATFSVDRSNRRDCFIISRFGMSEKCVRYVEGEFFLNDSGLSVSTRDEEGLRQEFLDRVLLARQAEIYSLGAGTAQRNLDINKFKQMQLTVPPVEVQDKIVAEYDAVSGVCGTAEQSYSHRAGSFRSLRQSVLAAAFRGDL